MTQVSWELENIAHTAFSADQMSGRFKTSSNGTPSSYTVMATTNLIAGPWINIITDLAGIDGLLFVTNSTTEVRQYYRAYIEE